MFPVWLSLVGSVGQQCDWLFDGQEWPGERHLEPGAVSNHERAFCRSQQPLPRYVSWLTILPWQFFYIQQFIYTFVAVFTKVSILLLYLRIFPGAPTRYSCFGVIGLTALFGMSCVISTGLNCQPVEYNWLQWDGMHQGQCMSVAKQAYALAGVNMSLDVLIFILPIVPLWKLQMSCKRRIGIICMFVVGFL